MSSSWRDSPTTRQRPPSWWRKWRALPTWVFIRQCRNGAPANHPIRELPDPLSLVDWYTYQRHGSIYLDHQFWGLLLGAVVTAVLVCRLLWHGFG